MDKLFVSDNSPKWIHQFLSQKSSKNNLNLQHVKVNMGIKVKVSTIMSESESITCDKKYKHILHLQYYTQNYLKL